jgi:hypothetical protein
MSTCVLDAANLRASESSSPTKRLGRPPKPRDDDDRAWRGVAPPPAFDIDKLPGSAFLTKQEVASVLRRAPGTLEAWRRDPDHPLKWEKIDGRYLARVYAVRAYLVQAKDK